MKGVTSMDIRELIIKDVQRALIELDVEVQEKVTNILYIQLQKYEVQERTTELVVHDNSFNGLINKFIGTKRLEGKAESTLKKYRRELQHLFLNMGKTTYEITTFDLRFYLANYKEFRKVKNVTLNNIRKTISSFFGWLTAEDIIQRNPALCLKKIKYVEEIKQPFSAIDLEKIKSACTSIRELALTEFLYASGLRVSEVVSLNIKDLNFLTREGVVTGKGGKQRKFYFTEVSADYLQRYLNSRVDNNKALFVGMFKKAQRYQKNSIERLLKQLGDKAEVENVHPHRFRRTLATDLVRKGMSIEKVAVILGHVDIRVTQKYVHVYSRDVKYQYNLAAA